MSDDQQPGAPSADRDHDEPFDLRQLSRRPVNVKIVHRGPAEFHPDGDEVPVRRLDGKFHVAGGEIVKSTSGEIVPHDEPLWLLRARDYLALPTLEHYIRLNELDGCTDWQLDGIRGAADEFLRFVTDHPERVKQPGITRGAAFAGEKSPMQIRAEAAEQRAEKAERELATAYKRIEALRLRLADASQQARRGDWVEVVNGIAETLRNDNAALLPSAEETP